MMQVAELVFFIQKNQWESLPLLTNRSCTEADFNNLTNPGHFEMSFILDQKEAEIITFTVK